MKRIFCNVENQPYPADDFFELADGVTVHRKDASTGHTLDGWLVTFRFEKGKLVDAKVSVPPVAAIRAEDLP